MQISEQLLRDVHDPERAAEVAELKDQARIGDLAETKMAEAQQALEQFVYDRAAAAVAQAEEQYGQLPPEIRPDELIATYKDMAARGMAATGSRNTVPVSMTPVRIEITIASSGRRI